MQTMFKLGAAIALALAAIPADALTVSLGASSQLLTLYGLGPLPANPARGTFAVGQGASSFDGTTSTYVLSGAILSGSPGYDSGTYAFVTTVAGPDTPQAGPNAPRAVSNAFNLNQFNYLSLDPSTTITLLLNTPGQNYSIPLFAAGNFAAGSGFSFLFTSAACTGVATCSQNLVGQTPGASIFGTVTISAAFTEATPVNGVPEPATWGLMTIAFGIVGIAGRRRSRRVRVAA